MDWKGVNCQLWIRPAKNFSVDPSIHICFHNFLKLCMMKLVKKIISFHPPRKIKEYSYLYWSQWRYIYVTRLPQQRKRERKKKKKRERVGTPMSAVTKEGSVQLFRNQSWTSLWLMDDLWWIWETIKGRYFLFEANDFCVKTKQTLDSICSLIPYFLVKYISLHKKSTNEIWEASFPAKVYNIYRKTIEAEKWGDVTWNQIRTLDTRKHSYIGWNLKSRKWSTNGKLMPGRTSSIHAQDRSYVNACPVQLHWYLGPIL